MTATVDMREIEHWIGGCWSDGRPDAGEITGVTPRMGVYDQEVFGPVLSVVRAADYEEALAMVNGNPYGNGAVVYTRDGGVARSFEVDATAGLVGVNVPIPVPVGWFSFGGWKASLLGDAHVYGPEGIRFNTRAKVVTRRWGAVTGAVSTSFPASS